VWQFKIRTLRKKVKGWSRNRDVELRKGKEKLMSELDVLDLIAEHQNLTDTQRERRKELSLKLEQT
jgi:hypothetical protein